MSKSLGNFTDPNELMDKFSADSLRFLMLSSPLLNGEDFALHDKDVGDVAHKLSMIWNMYDFFTMYAEVDGWEFNGELTDPLSDLTNPLDIWIVSRLHQLVAEVERHMDTYNIPDALSPILPFLDDATNWYVRRSRRRFWKSEDDGDKNDAYRTLHYVLVRLSYMLAPFTPFLAEELYHNLTGDDESIHLKDWLPAGEIDSSMLRDMNALRAAVNDGLSKRAAEGIKVRQPLASAKLINTISQDTSEEVAQFLIDIARDELNVKSVEIATDSESEVRRRNRALFMT
ncbi:class I tRNA ligase family protein [Candidatus Minimicrobia naudis]